MRTRLASRRGPCDLDYRMLERIDRGRPPVTQAACRAHGLLLLPIDHNIAGANASSFARLPMVVATRWPKQLNPVLLLTVDKQLRINEPGISDVHIRQQVV